MALSIEDRQSFLAEPHIGALAIAEEPGRGPLTLPIWYHYRPGGDLWVLTAAESRKGRLIAAAGRFSLMVERLQPSVRYVSVEGPVVRTELSTDAEMREMTERYLPAEQVDGYLEMAAREQPEHTTYVMRPERWYSADLGAL
jgi:nitroimidazol reductase NimA-like FMN-containing flavoprotein (pyridoxamine 5'-phosphate oxidase superfamily)